MYALSDSGREEKDVTDTEMYWWECPHCTEPRRIRQTVWCLGGAVWNGESTAGGSAGGHHGETGAAENDGEFHGGATGSAGAGGLLWRGSLVCHGGFHDGLRQGRCALSLKTGWRLKRNPLRHTAAGDLNPNWKLSFYIDQIRHTIIRLCFEQL